jgi:hypothetical protein
MRMISRSSHSSFRQCPRRFYYGYTKDGTGYTSDSKNMDLVVGLAVHAGMEKLLLSSGNVEEAVNAASVYYENAAPDTRPADQDNEARALYDFYLREQANLVEALIRGWYRTRWPVFHNTYEVVAVEQERRTLLSSNVVLMSREDALVRLRETGQLVLLNWKTTSSLSDWETKWHYDIQAWSEALAIEHETGEPVAGCIFEGLYKGTRKDNRQCTSLLYGYKLENPNDPEATRYSVEYKAFSKTSPWKRFRVWEEKAFGPKPLNYWINWLPFDEVAGYFPPSNPVFKDDQITQGWINSVVRLETEIEHILRPEVTEEERLVYFTPHYSAFNCKRCSFKPVCFGERTFESLLEDGKLIPRVDHHKMEGEDEKSY